MSLVFSGRVCLWYSTDVCVSGIQRTCVFLVGRCRLVSLSVVMIMYLRSCHLSMIGCCPVSERLTGKPQWENFCLANRSLTGHGLGVDILRDLSVLHLKYQVTLI